MESGLRRFNPVQTGERRLGFPSFTKTVGVLPTQGVSGQCSIVCSFSDVSIVQTSDPYYLKESNAHPANHLTSRAGQ